LRLNTTGERNVAIGVNAHCTSTVNYNNVAIGHASLRSNYGTYANNNTAVGAYTLYANTTNSSNSAFGSNVLKCNTGFGNSGFGSATLLANTTGTCNTGLGLAALRFNTTGGDNTAVGSCALYCNTVAITNTAVGSNSSKLITTGGSNTSIGFNSLATNVTGVGNTAVGHAAQCSVNASLTNTIAVGCGANTSATNNHTVWGNSANNVCNCVYKAWEVPSDCRDKTNIETLPDNLGLRFIKKLRPVSFNWDHRDTYVRECGYEYGKKDGTLASDRKDYGFVAQEVYQLLTNLNVEFDGLGHDSDKEAYRIGYESFIGPIVKAIQELENRVAELEEKKLSN
jgi:hypothetical protein